MKPECNAAQSAFEGEMHIDWNQPVGSASFKQFLGYNIWKHKSLAFHAGFMAKKWWTERIGRYQYGSC